ncbi:MAG: RNA polymerase subunit sigma-70, partial [Chloroflexi bacterium]|nr:RNA polymerase subunit sigma-70 [Chloroflexota bacterium]
MINNDTAKNELRLVRQAKAGDREAFGQLMENHAVRAYRIAFSILQNQSEAEDAVQEAFITAFKSIKKLE